ncbi:hypothetical protein JSE7799_00472 [Jannaschia seosinensis]|uniref:Apolipoprotein acyltransferase n=1 Tax=Jannaschia seosinensis TaxID=313367 RepID=A0A0M7B7I4_9RHOB|nr:hypothetical protein [Jannaschia seosinensis]CUH19323.1 hypothetical protein JSE7799_00472 [Jannaschia seosinensis]
MLPIVLATLGAILGAFTARRRKGNGFDIAQWAVVWAIIGGLIGLFLSVLIARL